MQKVWEKMDTDTSWQSEARRNNIQIQNKLL